MSTTETDLKTPDATDNWVDRMPAKVRPFLRLMRADRPVGIWLLFFPCVWGTLLARPTGMGAEVLYGYWALFLLGAFVMRSAGCIFNDVVDRKLDLKVERTANRPLASGQVSVRDAWILLVVLCLIGLGILLQLGTTAIFVGLGALILVAIYPFMKRITWWPQAWLGLTMNWGILVGAATVSGTVPTSALLLYAGSIFWTIGYDTIYAHQDREDDALAGVKSTALLLKEKTRPVVAVFYGLTILLAGAGLWTEGVRTGLILLLPALVHLAGQVVRLDIHNGPLCLMLFKSNVTTALLIAMAMLVA